MGEPKLKIADTLEPTPPEVLEEEFGDKKKEQVKVEERGPAKMGANLYSMVKEKIQNREKPKPQTKKITEKQSVTPAPEERQEFTPQYKPPRKKTGLILGLIAVIGIGSFVAAFVFNRKEAPVQTPQVELPTTAPFKPYKPSVYADDPDILRLEEDMNVLDIELSTVPLPDSILIPPTLDYQVSFK